MKMDNPDAVKVGDPVKVFDVNGSRRGQPLGGYDGEVKKVGRTLVTIHWGYSTEVFRLDTGRSNDAYGHQQFKTLARVALDARRTKALSAIKEFGLEPARLGANKTPLHQLETLAEVIAGFATERNDSES